METPTSGRKLITQRNPTPRLSQRKKTLFVTDTDVRGEDILVGIAVMDTSQDDAETFDSHFASGSVGKESTETVWKNKNVAKSSTPRRSLRFSMRNASTTSPIIHDVLSKHKDKLNFSFDNPVQERDEDLEELFSNSMRLSVEVSPQKFKDVDVNSKDQKHDTLKRQRVPSCPKLSTSSTYKFARLFSPSKSIGIPTKAFYSAAKTPPKPMNRFSQKEDNVRKPTAINNTPSRIRRKDLRSSNNINKGVKHMIRKPHRSGLYGSRISKMIDVDNILSKIHNEKLRKLITTKRAEREQIEKVHSIFRTNNNPIEMARPLYVLYGNDDDNNNRKNTETFNYKYNSNHESIEADFSDIDEYDEGNDHLINALLGNKDDVEEEIIPLITHNYGLNISNTMKNINENKAPVCNRKFFKSGTATNTKKEVQITDHIKASVCNGKISILHQEKRDRKKIRNTASHGFSDEQATVNQILKGLDDNSFFEQQIQTTSKSIDRSNSAATPTAAKIILEQHPHAVRGEPMKTLNKCCKNIIDDSAFSEYRNRLPYNTINPDLIDQQHLLLDFLISNNICNDHNFKVFISDPDNNKEEAARIVDQVVEIVNEETNFRMRIPYNTTETELISQQNSFLNFLIENKICNEENFDIFIANYENRYTEAEAIVLKMTKGQVDAPVKHMAENTNKNTDEVSFINIPLSGGGGVDTNTSNVVPPTNLFPIFYRSRCLPLSNASQRTTRWTGGVGANQYQIDAGQKSFGAHQCKQCGLVYAVHEPEEEKLHRDFHSSLHVLRFKGWIDEDIVAVYPEWGADGRILRVTEISNNKRRERIMDILKVVDKELGFSSYIIPQKYVAYLAVRKCQIVGICLIQPIEKANKYINQNGVDCCTEEEFEAKCGVSRIWVSPLHRRLHIASKLIQAVQINTIFRKEIPLDKIAFSAPTEIGKIFAQKVTGLENFLVYQ